MIIEREGATTSADIFRILGDKQSKPVALLVSKDFNASVRLGVLISGILKLIFSGTRALTKLCSF